MHGRDRRKVGFDLFARRLAAPIGAPSVVRLVAEARYRLKPTVGTFRVAA
jgi:cobalamin biosynthesis protein CbiG